MTSAAELVAFLNERTAEADRERAPAKEASDREPDSVH
jgi:hypothetical protein